MDVVVLLEEEEAEEGTGEAEEPTEAPEQAASRGSFDSPGSPISQASGLADGVLHVHVE